MWFIQLQFVIVVNIYLFIKIFCLTYLLIEASRFRFKDLYFVSTLYIVIRLPQIFYLLNNIIYSMSSVVACILQCMLGGAKIGPQTWPPKLPHSWFMVCVSVCCVSFYMLDDEPWMRAFGIPGRILRPHHTSKVYICLFVLQMSYESCQNDIRY